MTFDDHTQQAFQDIYELEQMGLIEQVGRSGCWKLTPAGQQVVDEINNKINAHNDRPFTLTAKGRELASQLSDNKE